MFIHNRAPFELGNKSVFMYITTEENPGVPLMLESEILASSDLSELKMLSKVKSPHIMYQKF